MGRFADLWKPVASRAGLVDGEPGIEIYPEIATQEDEIVIKKHRYSATDNRIILRGLGVETVVDYWRDDRELLSRHVLQGCPIS